MSRSDKRVAVPARKGDRVSGGGILIVVIFIFFESLSLAYARQLPLGKGAFCFPLTGKSPQGEGFLFLQFLLIIQKICYNNEKEW